MAILGDKQNSGDPQKQADKNRSARVPIITAAYLG